MKNITTTKRSYHPLVVFYYHAGLLTEEQLNQIPKTTIDYWRSTNHTNLFGYDWVSSFYTNYSDFNTIQKHKIVFKSARLCCKLFDTVSVICKDVKGYKRVLKNNIAAVIDTIDYVAADIKLNKACRIFNISTQQYYRFNNKVKCTASVLNLCFKTHPHQLTIAECSVIKQEVNDSKNYHKKLSTIYYKLLREGKVYCSRSTLYKYAALVSEKVFKQKTVKPKLCLRANRIFEYIHIDTTFLPTLIDGSVRAVIIKDNWSKKILHKGIVDSGDSKWVKNLLEEMFCRYNLYHHHAPVTLVSDGGSENKGEVIDWVESINDEYINKKTAKTKGFAFTNNEIESTFNTFKNEFLACRDIHNKEHTKELLNQFHWYNDNERYPIALYGYSPQEVFDGAIPDKHRFSKLIKHAAKNRHHKNKLGRFCDVCSER